MLETTVVIDTGVVLASRRLTAGCRLISRRRRLYPRRADSNPTARLDHPVINGARKTESFACVAVSVFQKLSGAENRVSFDTTRSISVFIQTSTGAPPFSCEIFATAPRTYLPQNTPSMTVGVRAIFWRGLDRFCPKNMGQRPKNECIIPKCSNFGHFI